MEECRPAEEQSRPAKQLRKCGYFLASAFALAIVLAAIALFFGKQAHTSAVTAQTNERTAEQTRQAAEVACRMAEQERRTAFARELAASALNNMESDGDLSLLPALQGVSVTYSVDKTVTAEVESAKHRAVRRARGPLVLRGQTCWVERANLVRTERASRAHGQTKNAKSFCTPSSVPLTRASTKGSPRQVDEAIPSFGSLPLRQRDSIVRRAQNLYHLRLQVASLSRKSLYVLGHGPCRTA